MESLLRFDEDEAPASAQAPELWKASVPSNIHVVLGFHGAVSAEPSSGQAPKCHKCLPKGQFHQYTIVGNCLFCLHLKPTLLKLVLTQHSVSF